MSYVSHHVESFQKGWILRHPILELGESLRLSVVIERPKHRIAPHLVSRKGVCHHLVVSSLAFVIPCQLVWLKPIIGDSSNVSREDLNEVLLVLLVAIPPLIGSHAGHVVDIDSEFFDGNRVGAGEKGNDNFGVFHLCLLLALVISFTFD